MRYRYIHEKAFSDGTKALSNIVWDSEGNWPMKQGEFPKEHPSHRFAKEFQSFAARGYEVTFLCEDGDTCSLGLRKGQTRERVIQDISECLGWELIP